MSKTSTKARNEKVESKFKIHNGHHKEKKRLGVYANSRSLVRRNGMFSYCL